MNLLPKFLEVARKYAVQHEFDKIMSFRHTALVVSGGRIISIGFNSVHKLLRFDPELARKARRHQSENHAESSAILNHSNPENLRGAKVYVIRTLQNGQMANSKPCHLCQGVAYKYGISRIIYSIDEQEYGVWVASNYGHLNPKATYHQFL